MITRDEANQIWKSSQSTIEEKTIEFYEEVVDNLIIDAAKEGFNSIEFLETSIGTVKDGRMEIRDHKTGTPLFYIPPSFTILRELLKKNGFSVMTYPWADNSISWIVSWEDKQEDVYVSESE